MTAWARRTGSLRSRAASGKSGTTVQARRGGGLPAGVPPGGPRRERERAGGRAGSRGGGGGAWQGGVEVEARLLQTGGPDPEVENDEREAGVEDRLRGEERLLQLPRAEPEEAREVDPFGRGGLGVEVVPQVDEGGGLARAGG